MPRSGSVHTLGAVLRRVREERGETREAIAYKAGITTGTLARLELGQSDPSWSTICAVMDALGVTLTDVAARVQAHKR